MNLVLDLGREFSPASYLRRQLPSTNGAVPRVLRAALEAGLALEEFDMGRARRCWRIVLRAAEREGRAVRESGGASRRLAARMCRVRDDIEMILFDGWLPPDLAARAAQLVSRMSARYLDRALLAYWSAGNGTPH